VLVLTLGAPAPALAQAWEINTYGNGQMLLAVFNGLATFAGPGGALPGALKMAALVGLLTLLVGLAGTALSTGRLAAALPQAAIVAGVMSTLSTSLVNVTIIDRVRQTADVVANVPLPVALIGYLSSAAGARITEQVEQAIQPVDAERFMSRGLGWGPRVTQETLNATIKDPNLREDLDAYIQICLWESFQRGDKTAETLLHRSNTDDIFGGTNPAIDIILPSQAQNPPASQNCPMAWENLSTRLSDHATSQEVLQYLAMQLNMPSYGDVLATITDAANDLLKVSISGAEALKLRFALNRLLPAIQSMAAIGGQSAIVTAWALAEAQAQQTSAWLTTGLLLQQILPVFHGALEFLFYGFTLLGLPLLIVMPRLLIQMAQTALWLQLWPVAYVFGNLFLYTQVQKVSLLTGDATQGLGLSLGVTPAIQGSIQSAYAASGFPIMIGVTMLGGMIFGGGYALQRAVMHGPWQAGGAFGSAAALGNVSVGNVGYEQRTLVPDTTQLGLDPQGREAIIHTRGNVARPIFQEFQTASGTFTLMDLSPTGPGSFHFKAPGEFGLDVTASGQGLQAYSAMFSQLGSQQSIATLENAYTQARTRAEQSGMHLATTTAETVDRFLRDTQGVSKQKGYEELTARREGLRHAHQQVVQHALEKSGTYADVKRQLDQHQAQLGLTGELRTLINPSGGVLVMAIDSHGKEHELLKLTDRQSRQFTQSYAKEITKDTTFQKSLREFGSAASEKGLSVNLSDVQQRTKEYSQSISEQETAQQRLQTAEVYNRIAQRNLTADFLEFQWRQAGYTDTKLNDALRSADPNVRMAAQHFLEEQNKLLNEGGKKLDQAVLQFAQATQSPGARAIGDARAAGEAHIGFVDRSVAGTGPQSLDDFRQQHYGDDPQRLDESRRAYGEDLQRPALVPLRDRVEGALAKGAGADTEKKAEEGRTEANKVTSKDQMEKDLKDKSQGVGDRTVLGESAAVLKEPFKEGLDTVKRLTPPDGFTPQP